MSGARDHLDQNDVREGTGSTRRGAGPAPQRAIAGRDDPRLVHAIGAAPGLLHLQRTAGNAAVSSLVAPAVQRAITLDEMGLEANPYETPATEAPTTGTPGAAASGATGPGGPVTSDGATTTITGATINLESAMTQTGGVIRAGTIIADSVVATNYTPGAGNVW